MVAVLPKRNEVPEEHTWDIKSVYPTDEAWEGAYKQAEQQIESMSRFSGRLGESAAVLLEALQARDEYLVGVLKLVLYGGMQATSDITNQDYPSRQDKGQGLFARAAAAVSYYEPEILALGADRVKELVSQEEGLQVYQHFFDKLETQREHVRSAEVESLLAEVQDVAFSSYRIHTALENADLKFATIKGENGEDLEVMQGNIDTLIRHQDREVRKAAWEAYADGYISVKNTMAGTLLGQVKTDVFFARARKYPSALDAALAGGNIPREVYFNLLDTFKRQLPVWHRYYEIRKRALGVESLHGYDIDVPLLRSKRKIEWQEGCDIVIEGMKPLGGEYNSVLTKALREQRWVDIYPNQGKGSGAFSYGTHGTYPFLMMNYDDSLESVSTLAHELGHSMHSYFSWKNQPPVYASYSMFVAETASNFNQAMVRAHLLKGDVEQDFELEILAEAMSNLHRYLFIMPTLARFELDCHERVERGESLTADAMSSLMADLYAEAYGEAVTVDRDRVGITWALFPHMFGNFYVFQYATGISAANALAEGVLQEGPSAAERYVKFLSSGDAVFPIEALKIAGIDMNSPEPVEKAFGVLTRIIDRLDQIVGEGPLAQGGR
ncbi:MAG: oligoendopeptidase [Chloroflexia bacterium]|jgi:oligoendopeptidase F|nr:oligoendopeptidase [Chloroflexia bacterium]